MAESLHLPIADRITSGTYLLYDHALGTGGVITRFYSIDGQTRRYFRSRRN